MINPLDSRNPKKLKNQKLKPLIFFVNTRISVIFFKKSQNNNIIFQGKFKQLQNYFGF